MSHYSNLILKGSFSILLVLSTIACGQDEINNKKRKSSKVAKEGNGPTIIIPEPTPLRTNTEVLGVWESKNCLISSSQQRIYYKQKFSFISPDRFEYKRQFYFDSSNCDNNSLYGYFSLRGFVTYSNFTSSGNTAFDVNQVQVFYTNVKESNILESNRSRWCEISDWVINVERSVGGKNCGGTVIYDGPIYDIFKLSGSEFYHGLFTAHLDGRSPDSRPTALDLEDVFLKK